MPFFGIPTSDIDFEEIARMDAVQYVEALANIGKIVGEKLVVKEELK